MQFYIEFYFCIARNNYVYMRDTHAYGMDSNK